MTVVRVLANADERQPLQQLIKDLSTQYSTNPVLISLYITPNTECDTIIKQLQNELIVVTRIKSDEVRTNVATTLDRIIHFLHYTHPSFLPNGMAIFCGDTTQLYWIEPSKPITVNLYRCDHAFVTGMLVR